MDPLVAIEDDDHQQGKARVLLDCSLGVSDSPQEYYLCCVGQNLIVSYNKADEGCFAVLRISSEHVRIEQLYALSSFVDQDNKSSVIKLEDKEYKQTLSSNDPVSISHDGLKDRQHDEEMPLPGDGSTDIEASEIRTFTHSEPIGNLKSITVYSDITGKSESPKKCEMDELFHTTTHVSVIVPRVYERDTNDTQDSKIQDADRLLNLAGSYDAENSQIENTTSENEIPAYMYKCPKRKRESSEEGSDNTRHKTPRTNSRKSVALTQVPDAKLNVGKFRTPLNTVITTDSEESTESTIEVRCPTSIGNSKEVSASSVKKRRLSTPNIPDPPTSSALSYGTRSTASIADPTISPPMDGNIRVFYASNTNVDNLANVMKALAKQGAHKATKVKDCDYLCVGHGKQLKKSANLVLAVAMGKYVITDNWAKESAAQARILNPLAYLVEDPVHEAEWGIKLREASERGRQNLKPLQDRKILFTPYVSMQSSKNFADIKEIAKLAGASSVLARLPRPNEQNSRTLIISAQTDPRIDDLRNNGWRCFTKDIITISVLRGALNTDSDEFLVSDLTE